MSDNKRTTNNNKSDIDALLSKRKFENCSPSLASNIIVRSKNIEQQQKFILKIKNYISDSFINHFSYKPSYAFATLLVMGSILVAHTYLTNGNGLAPEDEIYLQEYLYLYES